MCGIRAARAARRRIAGRAAVVGSLAERDEICEQPIRSRHSFRELAKPREAGVHEIALPVPGHEQAYAVVVLLLGNKTSKYYLYWVPRQYVRAIKRTVLGYF